MTTDAKHGIVYTDKTFQNGGFDMTVKQYNEYVSAGRIAKGEYTYTNPYTGEVEDCVGEYVIN